MRNKTVYILIIIILIIAGIFVATKIADKYDTKPVVANTLNNTNKIGNQNNIEENNVVDPEQNEIANEVVNNEIKTENTESTPEEQAKQIVIDNWGEDETVYYSYDGKDANGRYVICVREKSTTKALYRYYVDLETGAFEIE